MLQYLLYGLGAPGGKYLFKVAGGVVTGEGAVAEDGIEWFPFGDFGKEFVGHVGIKASEKIVVFDRVDILSRDGFGFNVCGQFNPEVEHDLE